MEQSDSDSRCKDHRLHTSHIEHLNRLIAHMMDIGNGYGCIEIQFQNGQPVLTELHVRTRQGRQYQ